MTPKPFPIAQRVSRMRESPTLAVMMEAKRLKSQGVDVIDFGPGEPDFPTPEPICRAAAAAISAGHTHYTDPAGIIELRQAISAWHAEHHGTDYDASEVLVGCGAKNLLFLLCLALFESGDRVALFSPYWVSFPEQIRLSEAEPVIIHTDPETGFVPTAALLETACDRGARAVILNSPCNPTGATIPVEEMDRIVSVIEKRNLLLISDECYEAFVYTEEEGGSFARFHRRIRDRLIIVNSFSKKFAMTGWRVGYLLGPEEILRAVRKLQSHDATHTSSISQWAAVAAIQEAQGSVRAMREEFRQRRDLLLKAFKKIPGISCSIPTGAFYAFPNLEGLYRGAGVSSTAELSAKILREARVATVPGEAFGHGGHVRISYALSRDRLLTGLDRLRQFAESV